MQVTQCQIEGSRQIFMSFLPLIIGYLFNKGSQKGGHRYPRTPPPSYAPGITNSKIEIRDCLDWSDLIFIEAHNHLKFLISSENIKSCFDSGAPAAWRAAKQSTIIIEKGTTCMHRNRNPCNSFFMVNMASGVDHGRMRLTTLPHNMAAIQLIASHAVVDYSIHLWY